MVGILVVDHRLLPQLADQGDLSLLSFPTASKMFGHFEPIVFDPVPTDADAQPETAAREQVDVCGLFGKEGGLPLG